ncbi:MAG TPA: GH25 family lysozyme [Scandinavium sp.]|jgi:hypothetical protein
MLIADTNEFHPLINAEQYKSSREPDGTYHPVIIARATYSDTHVDNAYVSTINLARAAGLHIGHYGYLTAGGNPVSEGTFFARTILDHGGLKLGDSVWCDDEEGSGIQTPRAMNFLGAAHSVLHDALIDEGVYSGAAFWVAHLGSLPSGLHRWVASYGSADPKLAGEDLWQFADNRDVPGVQGPCDASIYKGTLDDWLKMVSPPATPSPTHIQEDNMLQYIAAGDALPITWPDGAKAVRLVSNSDPTKPVPVKIDWYITAPDTQVNVGYGNVVDVEIPGGRGATLHRSDAPGSETATADLGFIFTS